MLSSTYNSRWKNYHHTQSHCTLINYLLTKYSWAPKKQEVGLEKKKIHYQLILNFFLLYDAVIPLWGMYPKELKSGSLRNICTPMFTAELFIIAKI